ncbi:hypothetical protein ACHAW5_001333 [Stephanodiscus triporus]|uniref:Photosystem I assembly protein Ycf4 n=1 Tax=Stephanodiscus triporus TaxID=2934178 RepID=A0ABD3NQF2_9STRA
MTNTLNFVAAASLLLSAANPSSAFRPSSSPLVPPATTTTTTTARSRSSRGGGPRTADARSPFVRRRRPNDDDDRHTTTLGLSPYDDDYDDDDDVEGYEVRAGDPSRRRPDNTAFGAENVPIDFRPSNEYLNLIRQPTFGWASQESGNAGLAIRLAVVYVGFFILVCYPISGATWVSDGYLLQKLTASNVGAISVVFVLVLRLYSGWGYIGSRLQSKVIEYEESGWYDGDFEEKSNAEKARDLFLYRSDVRPVEERLRKFALGVGAAWLASCVALNVATSVNPIFNQYDPRMLEKLSYDDKVAEIVQRQSNGRPTYCENRYYRAIANGGQGERIAN